MHNWLSIRKTATLLGVSVDTAFRWRHRFLESLKASQPECLAGVVEADETFFLEFNKGKRGDPVIAGAFMISHCFCYFYLPYIY